MTTIPVIRLDGVIAARGGGGPSLSIAALDRPLARAFAIKAPAVALVINSPGGSAAQSDLIARRVRQLAAQKKRKVLAFVEDVAASGGYWLACAADEVFVLQTSIVGSIGVIGATFGFPEALAKLGIERRIYTAGRSKSQLDPFRPENAEDVAKLQRILDGLHETFIAHVRGARGSRLKETAGLFEGEVFLGAEACQLGLADGLGDLDTVLRERYGKSVKTRLIPANRGSLLKRLTGGMTAAAMGALEERAAYARFGL